MTGKTTSSAGATWNVVPDELENVIAIQYWPGKRLTSVISAVLTVFAVPSP